MLFSFVPIERSRRAMAFEDTSTFQSQPSQIVNRM
jgi:hypothetical protein